jgi:hypothetical protein
MWMTLALFFKQHGRGVCAVASNVTKLPDFLTARWLMKVHNGLATYHDGGAGAVNRRCAMWLPTFLQRGIDFFGQRIEVSAFNNFVLFNRVHLPIIGKARGRSRGGFALHEGQSVSRCD